MYFDYIHASQILHRPPYLLLTSCSYCLCLRDVCVYENFPYMDICIAHVCLLSVETVEHRIPWSWSRTLDPLELEF